MLKKIVETWKLLTAPSEDIVAEVLGFKRGAFEDTVDSFFDNVVQLSTRNIELTQKLNAARTRASKNGCLALLAFGLIAIEILGVTIYFLPK